MEGGTLDGEHAVASEEAPEPDEHTRLMQAYHRYGGGRSYDSTKSQDRHSASGADPNGFGGRYRGSVQPDSHDIVQGVLGETLPDMLLGYGDRASIRSVRSGPETLSDYGGEDGAAGIDSVLAASGAPNGGDEDPGRKPKRALTTTQWLARTHGVKDRRMMYINYYFPFSHCKSASTLLAMNRQVLMLRVFQGSGNID